MKESDSDEFEYKCTDCGGVIAHEDKTCPHCGSDTSELVEVEEDVNDPELRDRISKLSNEDLSKMINVDFADYREEAIQYAEAEMRVRGIPNENNKIRKERPPRTDGQVSPPKVETSNEGGQRIDQDIKTADGDYLVIPFIGKIKGGFFSSENAETVSRQLQSLINQYSRRGWEFHMIAKVDIEVAPGCLASLFGAKTSYIAFDQVVFRRSRP